jgi:hypothetical protein
MNWDKDREKIRYQNGLLHQRLTWLGTFEGLLFVANGYSTHPYLLPLVGLVLAVSVNRGISSVNHELSKLDAQAYKDWRNLLMPGTVIPKVIAVAWAVLFLENFKRIL